MRQVDRILFVCVENACRSQMAEAVARSLLGERADIYSAGSRPAAQVNPLAIAALQEIGLAVGNEHPKGFNALPTGPFDYVVSMGCGDAGVPTTGTPFVGGPCPQVPAARRLDWAIPDPKGHSIETFREVRDIIIRQVRALVGKITRHAGTARTAGPAR